MTGIKVVDMLAPYSKGGKIGKFLWFWRYLLIKDDVDVSLYVVYRLDAEFGDLPCLVIRSHFIQLLFT